MLCRYQKVLFIKLIQPQQCTKNRNDEWVGGRVEGCVLMLIVGEGGSSYAPVNVKPQGRGAGHTQAI